jgi:hypothetical protein
LTALNLTLGIQQEIDALYPQTETETVALPAPEVVGKS